MQNAIGVKDYSNTEEKEIRREFTDHFKACPLPEDQLLSNLGLFLNSKTMSRILFMHHLYEQIIDKQGIIIDFGTRWGQNMSLFAAFRGMYEPFNRHRKIVGFDTFSGFPSVSEKDGDSDLMEAGNVTVTEDYAMYLQKTMELQEADNPLSHIKKFEIIEGDAVFEIDTYLERYPETIVALAYFDFDIYEPTKKCLEAIKPCLVKGSVLGFDELNDHDSPGETAAVKDVFGLNNIELKRYRYASRVSYFVLD
ncbi:MAG: hypothetical protein JXM79_07650 [Sedimentisphaerales bacterium]|nr:hypothetical protein [Sedimentisphaerales bacterium]